ncbi:MAG: pilus assembly protein TadG-related protein [Sphingomonadaceae bacterium]
MRARLLTHLARSQDAAVAPTVALSLFGLIAVGGIAFDYARMATLDTELQSAADQAALAAATQLDGKAGACQRAADAARALITNQTRFSNDGEGLPINITADETIACNATSGGIIFFKTKDQSEQPEEADSDSEANFVQVTVDSREAFFALTPIVAALRSGALTGSAYAGLGAAICKVPPLMLCNPNETVTELGFDVDDLIGRGLRLVANDGGGHTPGNFGFLETNGLSGTNALRDAMGLGTTTFECTKGDDVTTEPGIPNSVFEALNTRFDIYDNVNALCGSDGSLCPSSINASKDVVMQLVNSGATPTYTYSNGAGGTGWRLPLDTDAYLPTSTTDLTTTPKVMGMPRDKCHAVSETGTCVYNSVTGSRVGSGDWDVNAYWRVNHGGTNLYADSTLYGGQTAGAALGYTSVTSSKPTRYQVYLWEAAHRNGIPTSLPSRAIIPVSSSPAGSKLQYSHMRAQRSPSAAVVPTPQADRRRLSVAVVNCLAEDVRGKTPNVDVLDWIDVFLVEPTLRRPQGNPARTNSNDLYVEVIGATGSDNNGASPPQYIQKYSPYLIK